MNHPAPALRIRRRGGGGGGGRLRTEGRCRTGCRTEAAMLCHVCPGLSYGPGPGLERVMARAPVLARSRSL